MQKQLKRLYFSGFCLILLITGIDIFLHYDAHGTSWDEQFHYNYGDLKLQYYESLIQGADTSHYFSDTGSNNYPGLFDIVMALFRHATNMDPYKAGHLCVAISGLLAIIGSWCLGVKLGGYRAGFFAALFLVLTPRFYGHMWFNIKDVPFAVSYIWAIFFTIRAIEDLPALPLRKFIPAAIATGFALGIRPAALLVICYLGAIFALDLLRRYQKDKPFGTTMRSAGRYLLYGIGFYVIAVIAMLPWWPYAHRNPLFVPIEALLNLHAFPFEAPVLFMGQYFTPQNLPWSYLLTWIGITTPLPILFLWIAAIISGLGMGFRHLRSKDAKLTNRELQLIFLGLSFVFPIAYAVVTQPDLYDGLRQMLFILPVGIVIAALTLEGILLQIKNSLVRFAIGLGFVGASCILILPSYFQLHPYQYIYFNETIGGLPGAFNRFDTEYYGLSYKESADQLNAATLNAPPDGRIKLAISGAPWLIERYLDERFILTKETDEAEIYVSYLRWGQQAKVDGYIFGYVERMGIPLNIIVARSEELIVQEDPNPNSDTNE
ncbi:MAG: glycosyltransferase family 39 protein [Puniceicoccales bacterium]